MNGPNQAMAQRLAQAIGQSLVLRSGAEVEARRAARLAEERTARSRELRAGWNAPRRHVGTTPSRDGPWGEKLALLEARLGKGILVGLIGRRGTGKTQLAVELMKRVTADGRGALFRTAMELLMRFKGSYRKDAPESELEVFNAHRRPALLVLDEIGQRAGTAWENDVLFELLNQRYADMTDTVVTGNLSPAEFEANLGPSTVSRMRESGGLIDCDWPSFRIT